MPKYEEGGIMSFSDGRYYAFTKIVQENGKKYALLSTVNDPLEILTAEIVEKDGQESLRMISEKQEKIDVLKLLA